jgi:hypothetical protein
MGLKDLFSGSKKGAQQPDQRIGEDKDKDKDKDKDDNTAAVTAATAGGSVVL